MLSVTRARTAGSSARAAHSSAHGCTGQPGLTSRRLRSSTWPRLSGWLASQLMHSHGAAWWAWHERSHESVATPPSRGTCARRHHASHSHQHRCAMPLLHGLRGAIVRPRVTHLPALAPIAAHFCSAHAAAAPLYPPSAVWAGCRRRCSFRRCRRCLCCCLCLQLSRVRLQSRRLLLGRLLVLRLDLHSRVGEWWWEAAHVSAEAVSSQVFARRPHPWSLAPLGGTAAHHSASHQLTPWKFVKPSHSAARRRWPPKNRPCIRDTQACLFAAGSRGSDAAVDMLCGCRV